MDLTGMSKAELDALAKSISERQKEIKYKELNERREKVKAKIEKLKEQKGLILSLVNHSRTSCSDDNVCNGWGSASYGARCSKCHLIEILNGEWCEGDFDVDISVTITKVE